MDESANNIDNFEAILKTHGNKKPIGLYEKQNSSIVDTLKPRDVISTVSKQLRDLQRADCLKNERNKTARKHRVPEFLPVNVLSRLEPTHQAITKFETQCVSDTQLIDIVDHVEAIANKGMTQEFDISFCEPSHIEEGGKRLAEDEFRRDEVEDRLVEEGSREDKKLSEECVREAEDTLVGNHNINENNRIKRNLICQTNYEPHKDSQRELICKDRIENVYDIENGVINRNRGTGNDFETSYTHKDCQAQDSVVNKTNPEIERLLTDCKENTIFFEELMEDASVVGGLILQSLHEQIILVPTKTNKMAATAVMEDCVNHENIYDASHTEHTPNTCNDHAKEVTQDNIKLSFNRFDEKIQQINDIHIEDADINITNKNSDETVKNHNGDEKMMPSSPILSNFKLKRKSRTPLVFSLDAFERFESLAMPVMEDNEDFEKAKHLINSQILNKEFFIQTNANPVLHNPEDEVASADAEIDNLSVKLHKNDSQNGNEGSGDNDKVKSTVLTDNNKDGFEDEILFSSDEENDLQNDVDDLPFTCALKTSFYESEILDLDKTMFVGFQTASDKSILVCRDSYKKAKSILSNVGTGEEVSLTELVEIYDNASKCENVELKTHSGHENADVNSISNLVLENGAINNVQGTDFVGFKTANGKCINVTEKSMLKCRDIFKDIDGDFETKEDNVDESLKRGFAGFKTASNKRIKLSEEALAKTNNIFKDIDLNINYVSSNIDLKDIEADKKLKTGPDLKNANEYSDFNHNNEEHVDIIDQTLLQEFETDAMEEQEQENIKPEFLGFKTASDKHIKISEAALRNTAKVFECIDVDTNKDFATEVTNKKSSDNKSPYPCKDRDEYENVILHRPHTSNLGFQTASNKVIKISEQALAKTNNLFQDMDFEDICDVDPVKSKDTISRVQTLSKGHKSNSVVDKDLNIVNNNNQYDFKLPKRAISEKIELQVNSSELPKTKAITEGPNIVFESFNTKCKKEPYPNTFETLNSTCKDPSVKFQGFKTASNKSVEISEVALKKSRKIFQDGFSNNNEENAVFDANLFNDAKATNITDDAMSSVCFQGFKTASNRPVNVSADAMSKTKKIFQDIDIFGINDRSDNNLNIVRDIHETNLKNNVISKTDFQGFKTARNKRVNVSKEAFAKTKKIFDDIDIDSNNIDSMSTKYSTMCDTMCKSSVSTNSAFVGFKTASNKQVKISEDALAKSKNVFKDIDFNADISIDLDRDKVNVKATESPIGNDKLYTKTEELMRNVQNVCAFKGFQTASNKNVKVSEDALAKSRKIFEGINFDNHQIDVKENLHQKQMNKNEYVKGDNLQKIHLSRGFGFKTGSNKTIKVSEESLKKSRQVFADLDTNQPTTSKEEIKEKPNNSINIDTIMNTQVLNNFEETLHTEDFFAQTTPKTPLPTQQSKRSSSPILSCPKAKKRKKFETPYRNKTNTTKTEKISSANVNTATEIVYKFRENYKKNKTYTLKDLHEINQQKPQTCIDPYILNFNFETLLNFELEGRRNDLTDVKWTTDNIKTCFLESVNKKIIPDGWLDNHLKLVLWKLISYEIRFPNVMEGVCTVRNVLEQLKYRYNKELYNVERPALRKMLEKDDVSTRTVVLCVADVYVDGVRVSSIPTPATNIELLLTDGWYCIRACIDKMLTKLVCEGKIAVGRKIATHGAELLNCEQGVAPWENTSSIRLKLFGNSTRPARWDARLGYHGNGAILSQLSSVKPEGGKVSKLRVFVTRVYPTLYVEKFEDGSTVTRSERLEHLHQAKYEAERQISLEKIYEEVEKEFELESSESEGQDLDRRSLQSGSQVNKLMKTAKDPGEFRSNLTHSQAALLQEYESRKKENILEALQKKVQDRIQAQGLCVARNVVPLVKIRIVGMEDSGAVTKAMLSIWRPNDAILDIIKEGTWIDIFNVVPTAIRYSEIQMSAGRQSMFHRLKYKEKDKMTPYIMSLKRKCYTIKDITRNPGMSTDYNEIDTIGFVFAIEPSIKDFESIKGQPFQNVYITDEKKNIICINFWGGIKKFGYETILDAGNIVACLNLQKRVGNTRKSVLQYRATEFSIFTKTSKHDNARKMTEELEKQFLGIDKRKFCEECVAIKNNYATIKRGNTDVSPYRFNTSDLNLSKNKAFIDSPLVQNRDVNLNLTGLDFESTFKQTETQELSPAMLLQRKRAKEKMAKLKMYGEPPPLSKIHIMNRSRNAGSAYKSPLTSNGYNVARAQNLPQSPLSTNLGGNVSNVARNLTNLPLDSPKTTIDRVGVQSSPILSMNKTYVRSGVNPVKLNFSGNLEVKEEGNETNPFAEEFDASLPLSLD